ncbi:hypothetical protein [Hyalangium versicolor]|uniref:hypothetical protein n=1 Tax=Hyalangium versicolor TaxID=2861190 RepID=UPI001CCAE71B|nr:hypothetical protein [Hyalangium versicolor]
MARGADVAQVQDELIDAFKWGDEDRARELVFQLGANPEEIRAALETLLEDSFGLARQAAAFGLGELGGESSARRLEQQLAIEEAGDDYDGEAVAEDIIHALGRIEHPKARDVLLGKLERMAAGKPERSEVYALAAALWRRRHPELVAALRRSLARLTLPAPHGLHGLLVLLEKSPEELHAWARDPSVPVDLKEEVLVVLEEDVPGNLISTLPAFIAGAGTLGEEAMRRDRKAAGYCDRLFSLLLMDRERFLATLPDETRMALRAVARSLIAAIFPSPALRAASILGEVGLPEDAPFLEAHRPDDMTFGKVFDDAAEKLRSLPQH